MAKTVSRRLVVLSMASIAAIYLSGYAITEPAARRIALAESGDPPAILPPTGGPAGSPTNAPSASASTAIPSPMPTTLLPSPVPTTSLPSPVPTTSLSPTATPLQPTPSATARTLPPATATTPPTVTAVKRATPVPTVKPASTGLKDGAYSATGVSRRGDVTVAVTIQSGRIAAVDITQCMTQYPQSFIDGLPAEVVARQSAQVDLVSDATYSSRAFQSAVSQALAQARSAATATG